ncbi:substrate-binding domain-containing protein [Variovorax sp. RKNM96]|uniref:substrate-binding domain-containing protein n=1 Tax=Variovorax sp. RKNM96 TaxID=2681552 RepID=UPI00197E02CE|nr:substrate-binding domain-containing protein [Variovorax sp. RKNM96]QSI31829.1 substrate-binding domain-containing protein [Variovorax sp. RKNM96]
MTNRRIFSGIALAVCALASLPALAQNKATVMGVSVPAATHGWTGGVVYWANRTKAELEKQYPGMKVFVKTAGSATEQANQVQDLQTVNKIDTLVILPFESAPLTKPVAQVKAKGVFVTVVDRGLTDPNAQSAYVAGDNPGFGKVAGEYMAKTMGGKGNVVILRGIPTVIDNQRVDAFNEVMKANPGIKVLDAKHGNWNRDDAFKVMQDYLTRFKQIDAVWASDDDMAVGVQKAIEQAKRDDVKLVVGGAGAKGYIKKVMDGDKIVSADVTYAPSMIADAMNLTAKARVEGGAMPATTIIPSVLVTKENAAKYYFPDSPF